MLKKISDLSFLLIIIVRLLTKLALFGTQYLILKVKARKELTPILLIIFLVLSLINWQLWQKRKTPKTELKAAPSQNPGEVLFTLEKEELDQIKDFYLSLESKQKYSRDILFNLAKILEIDGSSLAQEKFQQAQELDPNYSLPVIQ